MKGTFARLIIVSVLACFSFILFSIHNQNSWILRVNSLIYEPSIKAFLDTIAFAEGTYHNDGYRVLYAGHLFNDFSDHPRCVISSKSYNLIRKKKYNLGSSAAGRYQILERIWNSIARQMKLKDFSPINQDKAAVGLIREMGALQDVLSCRFEVAVNKLSPLWSCFPGAPYGQKQVPLKDLQKFYNERLSAYKRNVKTL